MSEIESQLSSAENRHKLQDGMDACNQKYEQLQQLHEEAVKIPIEIVKATEAETIWKAKLKLLRAEAEVRRQTQPQVLVQEDVYDKLVEELQGSIDYLTDTLPSIKAEQQRHEQLLTSETSMKQVHEKVRVHLEDRLIQVQQGSHDSVSEQELKKELRGQIKNADNLGTALMRKTKAFLDIHFSHSPEDPSDTSSMDSSQLAPQNEGYVTLSKIIEALMVNCLDFPHDPYVHLDTTYWPPYIEMLKRVGLVVNHPDDSNRIRLTNFHI
ncbi:unnamed protein product [Owenia fusiformis]|uniref:Uncharacterized protein n=1 Tax=Owenia fusiformis TaxID=6347 RepID=A0A8J1Y401_OWEFU|nr:unnamed protein product [Owenia fusiformis]